MSKIKICGIRRFEDVTIVNKYLPEYIGFVFAESKRKVTPEDVRKFKKALDGRIKTAGIFVNERIERVLDTASGCGLDVVQVHGDEPPEYISNLRKLLSTKTEIWKAIRVKGIGSVKQMKDYCADAFVLDTYVEGSYGGAGKTFDWSVAKEAEGYGKIILAGGLHTENVQTAIGKVFPFAVDVSSGVETDGYKDEMKIRDFISRVRNYE